MSDCHAIVADFVFGPLHCLAAMPCAEHSPAKDETT